MSTPITDRAAIVLQQIDAALALAEKATKGPWTAQPADSPQIMSPKNEHCVSTTYGCYATKEDKANNATFIAASRTLLPASLRCLKTAIQAHLETLRGQWRDRATEIAERDLATLCDQWSAAQ
ncbi:hypothetical protein LBMAG57_34120 [Verrucomicrobiota bacterium]|nr:hypothetical protein LBMAG57_34120 [Verrucomicrobiota bacterium]